MKIENLNYKLTPQNKACLLVAKKAHKNQTDKGGSPYINHPIRVANQIYKSFQIDRFVDNKEVKSLFLDIFVCVALLHDVIEDGNDRSHRLLEKYVSSGKISQCIISSVNILTRQRNESYFDYIKRIEESKDFFAIEVKKFDLLDNMDLSRIPIPTKQDEMRNSKYAVALKRLRKQY